jgi:RNA polymerase sigma factor (TIGR02999 family)
LAGESGQVSALLERARLGEEDAAAQLMEAVHGELRRLARRYMRQERLDHTLQPTALVHEAYLRLFPGQQVDWKNHSDLLRCAARAMRQILVDHARRRNRNKRGGDWNRIPLDSSVAVASDQQPGILLALDEALTRLAQLDPRQAEIVELLYFTGMTQDEAANALDVSPRTVNREWRLARAWLREEVGKAHAV